MRPSRPSIATASATFKIATWASARRIRFTDTQLPYCHFVNRSKFSTLADATDYTQA